MQLPCRFPAVIYEQILRLISPQKKLDIYYRTHRAHRDNCL